MTTTARPFIGKLFTPPKPVDFEVPNDIGAEQSLIGSIVLEPSIIADVMRLVPTPDYFFKDEHQTIYRVMQQMVNEGVPLESNTIISRIKRTDLMAAVGGLNDLKEILSCEFSSVNWPHYAAAVNDAGLRRKAISDLWASMLAMYKGGDSAAKMLEAHEQRMFRLAECRETNQAETADQVVDGVFDAMIARKEGQLIGLPTGLAEIDNTLSGLEAGAMILVAARPGVGKTAMAMGFVEHVGIDLGKSVLVFNMEMGKQQLMQRMICSRAGVNSQRVRRGYINQHERDRLAIATAELRSDKIILDCSPSLSITEFRVKARKSKQQWGAELIVVDYLQLMTASGYQSRQDEVSAISRGIKATALELKIPVVALAQLNRASETERRPPRTSDLRESGSLEQDADVVILLHREAMQRAGDEDWVMANPDKLNEAIAIIGKNRNGPCGSVKLTYIGAATSFRNHNPGIPSEF